MVPGNKEYNQYKFSRHGPQKKITWNFNKGELHYLCFWNKLLWFLKLKMHFLLKFKDLKHFFLSLTWQKWQKVTRIYDYLSYISKHTKYFFLTVLFWHIYINYIEKKLKLLREIKKKKESNTVKVNRFITGMGHLFYMLLIKILCLKYINVSIIPVI